MSGRTSKRQEGVANVRITREHEWLPPLERGESFEIDVDGTPVTAYPGETVAAVLASTGRRRLHRGIDGSPRGLYCGIGVCYGCLVTIDGVPGVRACVTLARPGMCVQTAEGPGGNGDE